MIASRRNLLKLAGTALVGTAASTAFGAVQRSSFKNFDETYDVVIVGTGFAGLTCALRCSERKLKVLLIDKMTVLGGNSLICGGNFACPGNPNQAKLGVKDSRDIFVKDCLTDGL